LSLVFSLPVSVAGCADFVGLEEEELGDAFVGINACGQRRCVGKFQGDMAFPFRLQRRDVDDDAAARIGGFSKADDEHIAGDAEIFNGARQSKRIRWNDAFAGADVDEASHVKNFRVHNGAVDVGEDFEFASAANVISIAGSAIGNAFVLTGAATQMRLKRFNHPVLGNLSPNPFIALNAHVFLPSV